MKSARFPTGDEAAEPFDARVLASIASMQAERVIASPARAVRKTAAQLCKAYDVDAAFDDIDYGRWRGRLLRDIGECEPDGVAAWLTNPQARPHDGESIAMLQARVVNALGRVASEFPKTRCIVVTHAIVVKAALTYVLNQPLESVFTTDIAPLASVALEYDERACAWHVNASSHG